MNKHCLAGVAILGSCDACNGRSGLKAIVRDDFYGDVCNLCYIKRILGRDINFITGEKIPEGIRYPLHLNGYLISKG